MAGSAQRSDPSDYLVRLRRELHAFPELAFLEIWTAAKVVSEVEPTGATILTGGTVMDLGGIAAYPDARTREVAREAAVDAGARRDLAERLADSGTAVVVDIAGNRPGPTWALRFDMDGLPLTESHGHTHAPAVNGFRSRNDAMHACGHDGHVAIGIALARTLAPGDFAGHVRLVFQPAEEGVRGASAMVRADVMHGVDRFVALHLGLGLPSGVTVPRVTGMQATAKFSCTFTGVASHASGAPEEGRNAVAACASATTTLLGLPRFGKATTHVNVGRIAGGESSNVIAAFASLAGEVRSDSEESCSDLARRAQAVCEGAAQMWGCASDFTVTARAPDLISDDALVTYAAECARQEFGADHVLEEVRMPASDDAAVFGRRVQESGGEAAYLVVGGGNAMPHHHPDFDFDEAALVRAHDWLEALVRRA